MPKTPKRYRLSNRCLEQMNAIQEHHALPSSTAVIEFAINATYKEFKPMQSITKTYVCTCEEWSSDETIYSSLEEMQKAIEMLFPLFGNEAPELDDDNEDIFFFADGHREHVGHVNIEADRALASVDDVILHVRSGAAFIVTEFDDPYADDEDDPEAVAIEHLQKHGYTMQSTENTGDQQVWNRNR